MRYRAPQKRKLSKNNLVMCGMLLFFSGLSFAKLPDHYPTQSQTKAFLAQRSPCLFALGMTDGKRVAPNVVCILDGSTNPGGIYERSGCIIGQFNLQTGQATGFQGGYRDPMGGLKGACSKKHIEKMLRTPIEKFVEPRMLGANGMPAFNYFWREFEVHNMGVGVIYNPLNVKTPRIKEE